MHENSLCISVTRMASILAAICSLGTLNQKIRRCNFSLFGDHRYASPRTVVVDHLYRAKIQSKKKKKMNERRKRTMREREREREKRNKNKVYRNICRMKFYRWFSLRGKKRSRTDRNERSDRVLVPSVSVFLCFASSTTTCSLFSAFPNERIHFGRKPNCLEFAYPWLMEAPSFLGLKRGGGKRRYGKRNSGKRSNGRT